MTFALPNCVLLGCRGRGDSACGCAGAVVTAEEQALRNDQAWPICDLLAGVLLWGSG